VTTVRLVRDEPESFYGLLGVHPKMLALYDAIRRAAGVNAPVVICGPTGSGKELVARALHALSGVAGGPFCAINVAALPDGLVESELFGSVRGAFTGAADRRGLIDAAGHGTLFLDEAGDLSAHAQAKLLRVIEEGELRRVGASVSTQAAFRLLVAVRQDPAALVAAGRWRDDFYYRVTALVVRVPALTDRRSDIPLLVREYVNARRLPPVEADAISVLEGHSWPGNVRELQRTLLRAASGACNGVIHAEDILPALTGPLDGSVSSKPTSLRDLKHRHARATLEACGGNARRAAALLGVSRSHLYRLLRGFTSGAEASLRSPLGDHGRLASPQGD